MVGQFFGEGSDIWMTDLAHQRNHQLEGLTGGETGSQTEAGLDRLREHCDVELAVGAERSDLEAMLRGAAGLIVRSATRVDAGLLAAASGLKVIGRAGIGVDNIDLDAATEAGVLVVNAPTSNAVSAAQHTMS